MTDKITLQRPCQLFGRWWVLTCYEDYDLPDISGYWIYIDNDGTEYTEFQADEKGLSTWLMDKRSVEPVSQKHMAAMELELKPMYGNDFGRTAGHRVRFHKAHLKIEEVSRVLWNAMLDNVLGGVMAALDKEAA